MVPRIIAVQPSSGKGETVVVEVQQQGSHPLDLRLVGCEGENPYVATLEQRNLGKLKHKFKGSDDEWATVLSHFLLQQQPGNSLAGILNGVRMVYTLKSGTLELSIRQDVQGIKVTLGEIALLRDEEFEFNPFDWAQASAQAHAQTLQELADLRAKVSIEQETIVKLNAQLEDFIKTKNEAETIMLQQFAELLNEKKRKIRDQSRLLAGAQVDESTASAVQATRAGNTKKRQAGKSRISKRKAPAQTAEPDSDSDQMDVDQAKVEEQDEEDAPEPATPDRSDDETEAEEEDVGRKVRARSSETVASNSRAKAAKAVEAEAEEKSEGAPPQRSLPFARRVTRSKDADKEALPAKQDEDDETEDEEL